MFSNKYFHKHFSYTPYYVFQVQYIYYNPWKEDRFGGREVENNLITQGYVRTEESATCMVRMEMLICQIVRLHYESSKIIRSLIDI